MQSTYTRCELLHKLNNTCDIAEIREIAWLVNEEECLFSPAEFSEIYYHIQMKLSELATAYLESLQDIVKVMQATR